MSNQNLTKKIVDHNNALHKLVMAENFFEGYVYPGNGLLNIPEIDDEISQAIKEKYKEEEPKNTQASNFKYGKGGTQDRNKKQLIEKHLSNGFKLTRHAKQMRAGILRNPKDYFNVVKKANDEFHHAAIRERGVNQGDVQTVMAWSNFMLLEAEKFASDFVADGKILEEERILKDLKHDLAEANKAAGDCIKRIKVVKVDFMVKQLETEQKKVKYFRRQVVAKQKEIKALKARANQGTFQVSIKDVAECLDRSLMENKVNKHAHELYGVIHYGFGNYTEAAEHLENYVRYEENVVLKRKPLVMNYLAISKGMSFLKRIKSILSTKAYKLISDEDIEEGDKLLALIRKFAVNGDSGLSYKFVELDSRLNAMMIGAKLSKYNLKQNIEQEKLSREVKKHHADFIHRKELIEKLDTNEVDLHELKDILAKEEQERLRKEKDEELRLSRELTEEETVVVDYLKQSNLLSFFDDRDFLKFALQDGIVDVYYTFTDQSKKDELYSAMMKKITEVIIKESGFKKDSKNLKKSEKIDFTEGDFDLDSIEEISELELLDSIEENDGAKILEFEPQANFLKDYANLKSKAK